jgi:glycine/D-amino acid oxidase-like deaminating enzyme
MNVDYIIVGQGVSGSFLSRYLINAGKKVLVIDHSEPYSASKVASGVINPVTGRRIVSTWMIETLLPFTLEAYTNFGNEMGCELIAQHNILDFHPTPQMKLAFDERQPVENKYLRYPENEAQYRQYFNYPFGAGEINPCYLIDIGLMLQGWRNKLQEQDSLWEEFFEVNELAFSNDQSPVYKNITANKIIFCDGTKGFDSPYFSLLPYAKNKGEAVIVEIKGLPRTNIYKHGLSLVPWKQDLWWVGSTYEWNFTDLNPSQAFREKVGQLLNQWVKLPYTIVDHIASERPANLERRPFVGFHPKHPNVGILNGMGTKGCSLAPYFAHQLVENMLNDEPINPLADVKRFTKILSR